jgi:NADH dehydrogenase
MFRDRASPLESARADINDDASITTAVAGAFGVVNTVSLYVERGKQTFDTVHVSAAARLAAIAHNAGVTRLVHVSGIGADATSPSPYIRSRGEGEDVVLAAFPTANIIRPAVMFGPDDAFVSPLIGMLRIFPLFPMFGRGQTMLQPAYVEDVGKAIVHILEATKPETVYELAGPRSCSFKDLLLTMTALLGVRRTLIPMPFAAWHSLAFLSELLPKPPITRNQVELMQIDNVASPDCPGFAALGIDPHGIETVLTGLSK